LSKHIQKYIGNAKVYTRIEDITDKEVIICKELHFSKEVITQIIKVKPKLIGFVSDNDLNEDSVRALLEKDILPVGALDLPEKLPKSFLFIATPLKIRGRN
jgi:kynurenine formamidase